MFMSHITELTGRLIFCVFVSQITVPNEERRDEEKIYHKKTVADLETLAPSVSFSGSLKHLAHFIF